MKDISEGKETSLSETVQKIAQKWAPAFRIMILLCIFVVAFFVRIFSVISTKISLNFSKSK